MDEAFKSEASAFGKCILPKSDDEQQDMIFDKMQSQVDIDTTDHPPVVTQPQSSEKVDS